MELFANRSRRSFTKESTMLKYLALTAILTVVNGHLGHAPAAITYSNPSYYPHYGHSIAAPTIAAQHSDIVRNYGNLGSFSTYMRTVDTPFSIAKKSDFRTVDSGYMSAQTPSYIHMPVAVSAHAPTYSPVYANVRKNMAAHAQIYVHGPTNGISTHVPVYNHGLLGMTYSPATAVSHVVPALPLGLNYRW
ncbi:cuticle protein 76-like [Cephus cinctus]|uniref:Cuticle protein 76-like n=1 Tax=Cephus cinctus TaxID=211228 RepID=A0AAJ7BQV3_CEPCN|nr:cuticle protein 76-like [Cephus cinctus]